MSDKNDDLKGRGRKTVFEKIDETGGRPSQQSSARAASASSDFSFVPEQKSPAGDKKPVKPVSPQAGKTQSAKGDVPFGEADSKSSENSNQPSRFSPAAAGAAASLSKGAQASPKRVAVTPQSGTEGDVPFGESPVKEGKTAPVSAKPAASSKPAQPEISSETTAQKKQGPEFKNPAPAQKNHKDMPKEKAPQEKMPAKESTPADPPAPEVANPKTESIPKAEEMEVMGKNGDESTALSAQVKPTRAVSKWAFWKRGAHRDEQLNRISDGYVEMVDLVRAISSQLESQNENNVILRDSLAHLPVAMEGLDRFSESQHTVGEALKDIHGQMQLYSSKEGKLADSMDGFNSTLKGMDHTSKATMQTFDRVQERIRDSDNRMQSLFENVQKTEEKVSDSMVRLQRNMAIIQSVFLVCLLAVIGVLAFIIWESNQEPETTGAPANSIIESPGQLDQTAPVGVTPREPIEVVVPSRRTNGSGE